MSITHFEENAESISWMSGKRQISLSSSRSLKKLLKPLVPPAFLLFSSSFHHQFDNAHSHTITTITNDFTDNAHGRRRIPTLPSSLVSIEHIHLTRLLTMAFNRNQTYFDFTPPPQRRISRRPTKM
jgi:hypothetical protein